MNPEQWPIDQAAVLSRASFDLGCSKDQITLTVIAVGKPYWDDWANVVGASGCGGRITYLRTVSGTWIANVSTK